MMPGRSSRCQVAAPIAAVGGDGAYDKRKVFEALAAPDRGPPIRPIIPPRKDAKIQQHGNCNAEPLPRMRRSKSVAGAVEPGKKPLSSPIPRRNPDRPLQTEPRRHLARPNPIPPTNRNTSGMCHTQPAIAKSTKTKTHQTRGNTAPTVFMHQSRAGLKYCATTLRTMASY